MRITGMVSLAVVAVLSVGCSSSEPGDGGAGADAGDRAGAPPDAAVQAGEADADQQAMQLPSWMLEDLQPDSPRFGENYGLDAFSGQVIVAVLVDGF